MPLNTVILRQVFRILRALAGKGDDLLGHLVVTWKIDCEDKVNQLRNILPVTSSATPLLCSAQEHPKIVILQVE
jgi:hypothetical protein